MGRVAGFLVNVVELFMTGMSWQLILGGLVVLGIAAWFFGDESSEG